MEAPVERSEDRTHLAAGKEQGVGLDAIQTQVGHPVARRDAASQQPGGRPVGRCIEVAVGVADRFGSGDVHERHRIGVVDAAAGEVVTDVHQATYLGTPRPRSMKRHTCSKTSGSSGRSPHTT